MFPDNPQNLEELVDSLVRRMMAAERLLDVAVPRAARGAGQPDGPGHGGRGAGRRDGGARRRAARPAAPSWAGRSAACGCPANEPLGLGDATSAVARTRRPRRPGERARPGLRGRHRSTTSTRRPCAARSAARRWTTSRRCGRIERELERQGYLTDSGGNLELTPKAVRRLGDTALRRVFAGLENGHARRRPRPPGRRAGRRHDGRDAGVGVRRRAADRRAGDRPRRAAAQRRGGRLALGG